MTAPPSSIVIPASPLDAQLLSASSAFTFIASASHPNLASNPSAAHPTAPGGVKPHQEPQHFTTERQFAKWQLSNPRESRSLRPPTTSEGVDKMTLQGYRAPQHPASHLLQSIPPRAPSRSSRSNILSYTLHLATASRLSSYSSENGTRTLLHWAEIDQRQDGSSHYEDVQIDAEWFETEQKTQGLWKLGLNLLQSSRREGALPPSVERRVALAGLAEDLLVSPSGERAITKIDEDAVHPSTDVDELVALKPLTSPDTTTLYLSTSANANSSRSPRDRSHSVAQSLIDLKFGGKPSEATPSPPFVDSKPLEAETSSIPGSSVFGDSTRSASASTAELTATPHMDYRIVLSQSMRSRAKSIFAHSPLPSLTTSFCRRHRVSSCSVCTTLIAETSERASDHAQHRRRNVPGAGLRSNVSDSEEGGGIKKALVSLVPTFLKLSADFVGDSKARSGADQDGDEGAAIDGKGKSSAGAGHAVHASSAWYDLLTSLLTQACLEGYLVDGWTGTEGIETLFGVGCGVWEGRGWSTATRAPPVAPPKRQNVTVVVEDADSDAGEDDQDSDDDEEDEEELRLRTRERDTMELVEAAHVLFGSREVAQADYERGMRDRIHEFLNVPRDKNLIQHLTLLSIKYPLSSFEDEMVDFLEASVRALGKPALALLDSRTGPSSTAAPFSGSGPRPATLSSASPDPFALVQYFCATNSTAPTTPEREPSLSRPEEKRRRLE